jgi:hypothetical protein
MKKKREMIKIDDEKMNFHRSVVEKAENGFSRQTHKLQLIEHPHIPPPVLLTLYMFSSQERIRKLDWIMDGCRDHDGSRIFSGGMSSVLTHFSLLLSEVTSSHCSSLCAHMESFISKSIDLLNLQKEEKSIYIQKSYLALLMIWDLRLELANWL